MLVYLRRFFFLRMNEPEGLRIFPSFSFEREPHQRDFTTWVDFSRSPKFRGFRLCSERDIFAFSEKGLPFPRKYGEPSPNGEHKTARHVFSRVSNWPSCSTVQYAAAQSKYTLSQNCLAHLKQCGAPRKQRQWTCKTNKDSAFQMCFHCCQMYRFLKTRFHLMMSI